MSSLISVSDDDHSYIYRYIHTRARTDMLIAFSSYH